MCHHPLRWSEDCVDFNMHEEKKEPKKATGIVEKKLSDELEEAAENIYKTPFGTRAEDFKAGAEWMAGQGEVLTTETVDELCYDCHNRLSELIEKTGLSADDRVELIVRKIKEEDYENTI